MERTPGKRAQLSGRAAFAHDSVSRFSRGAPLKLLSTHCHLIGPILCSLTHYCMQKDGDSETCFSHDNFTLYFTLKSAS